MQDVTNSVILPSFLLYEGYFFPPWLYVIATSSFITRSVQLISIFLQHHFYLRVIKLKCVAFQYSFTQTSLINLAECAKFLTCIRKALYLTLGEDTIQKPRVTYLSVFARLPQTKILIRCLKMATQFPPKYFAIYYSHTSSPSKIWSESPITAQNYQKERFFKVNTLLSALD